MTETEEIKRCIAGQLPLKWQKIVTGIDFEGLEEIRLRCAQPAMAYYSERRGELLCSGERCVAGRCDMENILAAICKNSVYTYSGDIARGFVTMRGGHRAGISGRGVVSRGEISSLTQISGINIRVARQKKGCADRLIHSVADDGGVKNTLIISPPQCGKTTILRELARLLSEKYKVTIVDERSELAAMTDGCPGFDVGRQTDVLDSVPKSAGIFMALRSLSPEIILTDEIDVGGDIAAIHSILGAGAKIITSVHSVDARSFGRLNREFMSLFEAVIVLSRRRGAGTVEEIINAE